VEFTPLVTARIERLLEIDRAILIDAIANEARRWEKLKARQSDACRRSRHSSSVPSKEMILMFFFQLS
jgi:hypothetical protein